MNMENMDIFMKIGIFMVILSIICRIVVSVLYKVLVFEAERMDETKNPLLCSIRSQFAGMPLRRHGKCNVRISVEKLLKEMKIGHLPMRFLPAISLYCMLLALLCFGFGAYRRIREGMFMLEAFPFYIVAFGAVYLYLFVATLTDIGASRELLKELVTEYFEGYENIGFKAIKTEEEERTINKVGNISKKARNREKEKLLKEFLS